MIIRNNAQNVWIDIIKIITYVSKYPHSAEHTTQKQVHVLHVIPAT